jgi:hypothetical protein
MGGIFNANTHYIGLARKFKCPWCLKLITEQGSIFQKSVTECDIWDPWFHGRLSGRSCRYDKVDKCALMCYTSLGRRCPLGALMLAPSSTRCSQLILTCHTVIPSSSSSLWFADLDRSGFCMGSTVVSARVIVANPCIFHFVRLALSSRLCALQNATSSRRILLCFPRCLD